MKSDTPSHPDHSKEGLPDNPESASPTYWRKEETVQKWVGKKGENSPKLTEQEKVRLCRLLGAFRSAKEVRDTIVREYNKPITIEAVYYFQNSERWRPVIDRYRQEYQSYLLHIPIYHKRTRLERLEGIYQEADQEKPKRAGEKRMRRQELVGVLREARDESERYKDRGDTTNILAIQFNNLSDEELLKRKQEVLSRIKTIGGVENGTQEETEA